MLYASCNNYPEKIRNYLFEYNSYVLCLLFSSSSKKYQVFSWEDKIDWESAWMRSLLKLLAPALFLPENNSRILKDRLEEQRWLAWRDSLNSALTCLKFRFHFSPKRWNKTQQICVSLSIYTASFLKIQNRSCWLHLTNSSLKISVHNSLHRWPSKAG